MDIASTGKLCPKLHLTTQHHKDMIMKARSYLRNIAPEFERKNDWFTVKPGAGAVAVAMTTPLDELHIAGEVHDMTVMDPAELLERFEEYEDPQFDGEEWGIL